LRQQKKTSKNIGTKQQISVCEKFLWGGSFKNDRDVNHYFKIMDPLYIYNHKKKKRRKPSAKKVKSKNNIKIILSYDVLNVGFSSFLHKFNFLPKLKNIKCQTLILGWQK
jgi:proline iminopeptidase